MNEHDIPNGKKRTAFLPLLQVDLTAKLNRLKLALKATKKANTKDKQKQPLTTLNLTPMQIIAKEKISREQTPINRPTQKRSSRDQTSKKGPNQQRTKQHEITKSAHERFLKQRAKKHPEINPYHAPPMDFYYANRPFESRTAIYTEDKNRLEGCHQIYHNQTLTYKSNKIKTTKK